MSRPDGMHCSRHWFFNWEGKEKTHASPSHATPNALPEKVAFTCQPAGSSARTEGFTVGSLCVLHSFDQLVIPSNSTLYVVTNRGLGVPPYRFDTLASAWTVQELADNIVDYVTVRNIFLRLQEFVQTGTAVPHQAIHEYRRNVTVRGIRKTPDMFNGHPVYELV